MSTVLVCNRTHTHTHTNRTGVNTLMLCVTHEAYSHVDSLQQLTVCLGGRKVRREKQEFKKPHSGQTCGTTHSHQTGFCSSAPNGSSSSCPCRQAAPKKKVYTFCCSGASQEICTETEKPLSTRETAE